MIANILIAAFFLGANPPASTADDQIFNIGEQLRCPVCQGMPIAESPSEMAQDMMQRVRDLHQQGKSREEILSYFVDRYGEWVLLKPRFSGFSLLVWLLPPFALLLSLSLLWWWWQRNRRRQAASPADSVTSASALSVADDKYVQAIRREVDE